MRRLWWLGGGLLAAILASGPVYGDSAPAPADNSRPTATAPTSGELPLVLSIRALSVGPGPLTETSDGERVRASTGAGTTRWPSPTTAVGPRVYLSVMPSCIPGVDEPLGPGIPRRRR